MKRGWSVGGKAYLDLVHHVEHSLHRAVSCERVQERKQVLVNLFTSLCSEIDQPHVDCLGIQSRYFFELIVLGRQATEGRAGPSRHLDLGSIETELLSNEVFHSIYAMLFFDRVFEADSMSRSRIHTFLKGVNQLFWNDLTTNARVFKTIYRHVLAHIEAHYIDSSVLQDVLGILFKYFFYYNSHASSGRILDHFASIRQANPAASVKSLADLFVLENIVLLESVDLASSPARRALRKFRNVKVFLPKVSWKVRNKLKSCLYSISRPTTPNRVLRVNELAEAALDELFPFGKLSRYLLKQFARCLYQCNWPLLVMSWLVGLWGRVMLYFLGCIPCVGRLFLKAEEQQPEELQRDDEGLGLGFVDDDSLFGPPVKDDDDDVFGRAG